MKKFKFTLQSVHRVRAAQQDREVAALDRLRQQAEQDARSLADVISKHCDAVEAASKRFAAGEHIDPFELAASYDHIASLEQARRDAEAVLENSRRACEVQREKVEQAARDVKVTENLKEKQMIKHRSEVSRAEQGVIDELTSATIARAGGANR